MGTHKSGTIVIVGVGDDGLAGLTELARRTVSQADVILGSETTLALIESAQLQGKRIVLDPNMGTALAQVQDALRAGRAVLLSYGDPLFYGVARYLTDRLGKDQFEVLPHVSSMQLAFARVKESWDDAYLTSLEGRPLAEIIERIRTAEKVGLFSSGTLPPSQVARALLEQGIDYFHAYVCEHLGQPDERVTHAGLDELQQMAFDALHVLILVRTPGQPDRAARDSRRKRFGNPDDTFAQNRPKRALVTQAEVRSIALGQLAIQPNSVVWDIGAGSGSVAIEAAQLASDGLVFAIEPDPSNIALMQSNIEAFRVSNVRIVAGRAPDCLSSLPDPDGVFIGGTGRQIGAVVLAAYQRLRVGGSLALNVATLDAVTTCYPLLRRLTGEVRLWQIHVTRGIEQFDRVRFQAVNPTFLLAATKLKQDDDDGTYRETWQQAAG